MSIKAENHWTKSKLYRCGIMWLRVNVNLVFCVKCVKWINIIFARVKRLTQLLWKFCLSAL